MNDPERLIDGAPDDLAASILRAARDDEPEKGALEAAAAALGVGSALVGGLAGGAQGGAATSGAKLGALGILKWLGIGVVSGVVAAGVVPELGSPHAQRTNAERGAHQRGGIEHVQARKFASRGGPAPALRASAAPAAHAATVRTATPVPRGGDESPNPGTTATLPPPTAAFGATPAPAGNVGPRTPSLAAELRALDDARQALARHDAPSALRALDRYSKSRTTGALDPEADVLRIHALLQLGQRAQAVALARAFVARHPDSSYAPELDALVKSSPE